MLLFQEVAETAAGAAHAAEGAHGAFHPWLPWLILALPLLGFAINAAAAIVASRRALPVLPPVGDPSYDHAHGEPTELEEARPHGDSHHPATEDAHAHDVHAGHDDHGHAGPKPWTHVLPSWVAPGAILAAFAVACVNFFAMWSAHPEEPAVVELWSWMPVGTLDVSVAMQLDQLSMLMTLIVTGVGFLIHVFSIGYMREDPGYPRYMAYLNLFVFFMLTLVLGASYPVMFVGWEGVGLCSYLLIGFWWREKANADAGKKAFIVNRIGDFGFLIAMFLLFSHLGTLSFVEVAERAPGAFAFGGTVVTAIALFFFLGATGKSAQIPLHVWLPDAMAGPTPVSALIHAATMVTAGVYLVARSAVLFTLAPAASLTVAVIGALTAFFAATIGLKQWDIKKVLAYSTVSQLGFMFAGVGMGAYVAGVFHLMTHAFFKALLFLGSGAVIHAMHGALHATHNDADPQDMRNMGGLRKHLPITFATMGIATLAIAGVPGFSGFFSKDEIVGAAWNGANQHGSTISEALLAVGINGPVWLGFIWGTLILAAVMTAFYMGRMMIYTFFGDRFRAGAEEERHLHEGDWTLTVPLIVLAFLSVFGGWINIEHGVPVVEWFNWFGQDAALHEWLHPVIAPAEAVSATAIGEVPPIEHHDWLPIIIAIIAAFGGLALAWVLISPRNARIGTAAEEPAYRSGIEKILYEKWRIDELYDATVVGPVNGLSRAFAWFDRVIVDGLIDFGGRTVQALGLGAGRVQTGYLNTYAFVIVVGVIALLGTFVAL